MSRRALAAEQEVEVAVAYAAGATGPELAARYGCSSTAILAAVRRQGGTVRVGGPRAGVPFLGTRGNPPSSDVVAEHRARVAECGAGEQVCTQCLTAKPLSAFYETKKGSGKRFAACKTCTIAQQKLSARTGPYRRAWQEANRGHVRAANNASYARNSHKWTERRARRMRDDPEGWHQYVQNQNNRRRSRRINAFVEDVVFLQIADRDGYTCLLCGKPVDMTLIEVARANGIHPAKIPLYPTLDHIKPYSRADDGCVIDDGAPCPHGFRGGTHEPDNVQLAHWRCNNRKWATVTGDTGTLLEDRRPAEL